MNNSSQFHLRWRGRTTGPFPLEMIQRKLDEHEIGLWHEIGENDNWTTLGEFLEKLKQESRSKTQAESPRQIRPAYQASDKTAGTARPAEAAPSVPEHPATGPSMSDGKATGAPHQQQPSNVRNRKLFVVLGLLAGFTGAHNFYAGYWGTGLVQIILSGVTWILGFGIIISWLWALTELMVVYSDARGHPMN